MYSSTPTGKSTYTEGWSKFVNRVNMKKHVGLHVSRGSRKWEEGDTHIYILK